MTRTSSAPISELVLHALDHERWESVQGLLRQALEQRGRAAQLAPMTRCFHDLLNSAIRKLHLIVFRQYLEAEAGLAFEGDEAHLEPLYLSELSEHGVQNIADACARKGWHALLRFPPAPAADLVELSLPFAWSHEDAASTPLLAALGYSLSIRPAGGGCVVALSLPPEPRTCAATSLLDESAWRESMTGIAGVLGCEVLRFARAGDLLAVSPGMLARLRLQPGMEGARALDGVIPEVFRDEVIWGMAQAAGRGSFENYRIRLPVSGADSALLFNVSGYRDETGMIHTLWQLVSQVEGAARWRRAPSSAKCGSARSPATTSPSWSNTRRGPRFASARRR